MEDFDLDGHGGGVAAEYAIVSRAMENDRRILSRNVGIGFLAAVVLVAIVWAGWILLRGKSPVDTALGEVRRVPLIGQVMAENPAVEARLRKAIEEEIRSPTQTGLSRPFSVVADLRREYIVPALRGADDASALAAVAARADFVRYLRRADPAACRQFALGTLQRPDLLDAEGQKLFGQVLQTLEAAWRNGKAATAPRPTFSREELVTVLQDAGFVKADFDRLNGFKTLSNEASCDVELKVDALPPELPEDKRGPFARTVLSN
jgi:hypothetical protein